MLFHCPACGGESPPVLANGVISAHPYAPTIECAECGARWRVELYQMVECRACGRTTDAHIPCVWCGSRLEEE